MKHHNGGVIDTGNLEFISFGKVRVNKDFTGNITTTKTMRGEVTFVKTPDIYEIGSQTKQVSKVTFEGNHEHKLHNDIHSRQTNFDPGTYNIRTQDITINGNANINGSTFNLRRNVMLTGDVVLESNITINALGESGIVFQNLPTAFGTNIVININRAHTANDVAALSILRMSNGDAFVPNGYTYTAATGTVALPQGLQVQQVGVQAAAQLAHAQARAEAAIVGNVIVARETVDTLGQRQARLQQDMVAAPVRVQQQVDRENLRLRQAQNVLVRIQAENPQQLADAQQRLNAARAGADIGEQNRAQQALCDIRNDPFVAQLDLTKCTKRSTGTNCSTAARWTN